MFGMKSKTKSKKVVASVIMKNMKIKFNSNDDLPLNKSLKFDNVTIIIRSVFE